MGKGRSPKRGSQKTAARGAPKPAATASKPQQQHRPAQASQRAPIPFERHDDVLLVGEGDLSFAHCLLRHHGRRFRTLTATTLDSREETLEKYPQAAAYIDALAAAGPAPRADALDASDVEEDEDDAKENGDGDDEEGSPPAASPANASGGGPPRCTVLHGVDATRLARAPALRRRRFSRIVFNFPHVGGRSTDVNRQVRHNQQLVHAFLRECAPLLAAPPPSSNGGAVAAAASSTVLVTLFEGIPYTLWNVKDLARSAGLECRRSWAFAWTDWPGYRHARTLGNLRRGPAGGQDGDGVESARGPQQAAGGDVAVTKRKGNAGWRGEDRSARTYEFGLKGESVAAPTPATTAKRKRAATESSDEGG